MVRKLTLVIGFLVLAGATAPAASLAATPGVSTGGASRITQASARVAGKVNPQGQSTTYSFQYGTSTKYGASTPAAPAGSGTKAVNAFADLGGLKPVTIYHYRIVASSPGGVVSGADRTFKTAKVPLSLSVTATPNPVPFGSAATLTGQLGGTGGGGRGIQVQHNSFPYTAGFANTPVSPVVTAPDGTFSLALAGLLINAQVRVVTTSGQRLTSAPILVSVAPKVRTAVSSRHPRKGRFVRFAGTVTPSWVPAQIAIQRKGAGGAWITVAGVVTKGDGPNRARYAKSARIRRAGTYRVFAGLLDSKFGPSVGPEIRITPRSK
ncbi:MAG: hypothetical protein JWO02_2051 [Solirubrobacterales bacterium]|nr:hypothetical protein [Solirubrobacterales bacterium]